MEEPLEHSEKTSALEQLFIDSMYLHDLGAAVNHMKESERVLSAMPDFPEGQLFTVLMNRPVNIATALKFEYEGPLIEDVAICAIVHALRIKGYQSLLLAHVLTCLTENRLPRLPFLRRVYYIILSGSTKGMCGEDILEGVVFTKAILSLIARFTWFKDTFGATTYIEAMRRIKDRANAIDVERTMFYNPRRRDVPNPPAQQSTEFPRRVQEKYGAYSRVIATGIVGHLQNRFCVMHTTGSLSDLFNTYCRDDYLRFFNQMVNFQIEAMASQRNPPGVRSQADIVRASDRNAGDVLLQMKSLGMFDCGVSPAAIIAKAAIRYPQTLRRVLSEGFTGYGISFISRVFSESTIDENCEMILNLSRIRGDFHNLRFVKDLVIVIKFDLMSSLNRSQSDAIREAFRDIFDAGVQKIVEAGRSAGTRHDIQFPDAVSHRRRGFIVECDRTILCSVNGIAHEVHNFRLMKTQIVNPMQPRSWERIDADPEKLGAFALDILIANPGVVLSGSSPVRAIADLPQTSDCDFYVNYHNAKQLVEHLQGLGYLATNPNSESYGPGLQLIRMGYRPDRHASEVYIRDVCPGATACRRFLVTHTMGTIPVKPHLNGVVDEIEKYTRIISARQYGSHPATAQMLRRFVRHKRIHNTRTVISVESLNIFPATRRYRTASSQTVPTAKNGNMPAMVDIIVCSEEPRDFIAREFDLSVAKTYATANGRSIEFWSLYPDHFEQRAVSFSFDKNMTFNLQKRKTMMTRLAKYAQNFNLIPGSSLHIDETIVLLGCSGRLSNNLEFHMFRARISPQIVSPRMIVNSIRSFIALTYQDSMEERAKNAFFGTSLVAHENLSIFDDGLITQTSKYNVFHLQLDILADPFPDKDRRGKILTVTQAWEALKLGHTVNMPDDEEFDNYITNYLETFRQSPTSREMYKFIVKIPFFWTMLYGYDHFALACENYVKCPLNVSGDDLRNRIMVGLRRVEAERTRAGLTMNTF